MLVETIMSIRIRTALVALIALALAAGASAQLVQKKALNLEIAKQISAAAEKEAAGAKLTMVIAIVDDGGNLIYLERRDALHDRKNLR
jgi:glc operon protein GlcG